MTAALLMKCVRRLLACLAHEFYSRAEALLFEGEAEVGGLEWAENGRAFGAGLGLAWMAEEGRLHGVPLVVPNILAAARADERHMPEALVNLHGVVIRKQPLPFVEDRQVAPR